MNNNVLKKAGMLFVMLLTVFGIAFGKTAKNSVSIIIQPGSAAYQQALEKKTIDKQQVLQYPTVYFAFDKANIEGSNKSVITEQANYLCAHPTATVRLEGHTDTRGTHAYNKKLGMARAVAVKKALLAQGVKAKQIHTVSDGDTNLLVHATTPRERAFNRRVAMVYQPSIIAAASKIRWFAELGGGVEMPRFTGNTQVSKPLNLTGASTYTFNATDKQTAVPLLSLAAGPVFFRHRFWLPAFRFGLEYTHTFVSRVDGKARGISIDGKSKTLDNFTYRYKANRDTLMNFAKVNILDFHGLMPYALVGFGFSWNHFSDFEDTTTAVTSLHFANATTPQFAYELGAGVDYKISSHWWTSAEYRYGDYGDLVSGYSPETGYEDQQLTRHYTSNQVRVHIRYVF